MQKSNKIFNSLYFIILAIAVIFFVAILINLQSWNQSGGELQKVNFIGEYRINDSGEWKTLTDKGVTTYMQPKVTYRGKFDREIGDGTGLLIFINYIEVHISLNGEELYSYGSKDDYPPIVKSAGSLWVRAYLSEVKQDDELEIVLINKYPNNYYSAYDDFFSNIYVGDSGTMMRTLVKSSLIFLITGILCMVFGALLLLTSAYLTYKKIKMHKSVRLFAIYSVFTGVLAFISSSSVQLIATNGAVLMIAQMLIMLMLIPVAVMYLKSFVKNKLNIKVLTAIELVCFLWTLVFIVLQSFGILDAYEIRAFYIPFVLGVAVICIFIILCELKHAKTFYEKFALYAIFILDIGAVLESLNYAFEFVEAIQILVFCISIYFVLESWLALRFVGEGISLARRTAEMKKELAENRIAMALSQIQPHFLYNSLAAIRQLCETDSQRASTALQHFSFYLRSNLDSMTQVKLIPFTKELEHVQNYLYLEKMRFEDRLNIEYDLKASDDFLIPPLTLQPIVENAVRCGISQRRNGGILKVSSEVIRGYVVITVQDDGIGFDVEKPLDENSSHIGINNVRSRLRAQCGGSLEIESKIGVGTTVRIILPQEDGVSYDEIYCG